jgi:hypothetical protein
MALTMRGRGGREGYEPAEIRVAGHPGQPPSDDYFVESGEKPVRTPVSLQVVGVLEFILIVAIAILSLAVFWMVGLIVGFF